MRVFPVQQDKHTMKITLFVQLLRRKALSIMLMATLVGFQRLPAEDPQILRFSAIPDQFPARVLQQHEALMNRICAVIQKTCEWVAVESYDALVERVGRGEIDVAYMGAVGLARALHHQYAVPLAMRDIDFRFTSVIVVRKSSNISDLEDLRHTRFRFGNRSSASSHFMLRQRLEERNVFPERFFGQVTYAVDHDEAIRAVATGEVDAGGVNASVFYRRLADGDLSAAGLRAVWQSPPFNDYVWAARRLLSNELRQTLVEAFLDLELKSPSDTTALKDEGAAGYIPAFPSDFDEMTSVLKSHGAL